jgi:hypothetical protein
MIIDIQLLDAISFDLSKSLFVDIQTSPIFSMLVDEAIDWTMKSHFIICILYI